MALAAGQVSAQNSVYLAGNADLAVHPGDTVSIFGNVVNNGRFGSLNGSVVQFFGNTWQNGVSALLPDESFYGLDTTLGMGGVFRFLPGITSQNIAGGYSVTDATGPSFPSLSVSNGKGVFLLRPGGGDLKVRHTLYMENGFLFLNGSNLVVGNGAPGTISGYSNQRFVVTGAMPAGGSLYRESLTSAGGLVVFPIGTDADSYSPVALQNHAALPQTFRARVFDSVYSDATSGETNPESVVLKTWNIGQGNPSPADVSVWLQHDVQDEGALFPLYRDSSYISLFEGGAGWDSTGPKGVLNPGTLTTGAPLPNSYLNVRDFSGVLLSDAYLSVADMSPSTAQLQFQAHRETIRLVRTSWHTQFEHDILRYELQRRRLDEDSFYTVAFVPTQTPGGNSALPEWYYQDDDNYYGDITYYRLRIVGRDGGIHYSVVRLVPPMVAIVCAPNPNFGTFTVNVFGAGHPVSMDLYDMVGHRLGVYTINGNATISVPQLPAATYVLVFYDGRGRLSTQRIIILRH
jgi:hypothetical protein